MIKKTNEHQNELEASDILMENDEIIVLDGGFVYDAQNVNYSKGFEFAEEETPDPGLVNVDTGDEYFEQDGRKSSCSSRTIPAPGILSVDCYRDEEYGRREYKKVVSFTNGKELKYEKTGNLTSWQDERLDGAVFGHAIKAYRYSDYLVYEVDGQDKTKEYLANKKRVRAYLSRQEDKEKQKAELDRSLEQIKSKMAALEARKKQLEAQRATQCEESKPVVSVQKGSKTRVNSRKSNPRE